MKRRSKLLWLAATMLSIPLLGSISSLNAQESGTAGALVQEEGWQLVRDTCTECHSSQIIVQNSGNREVWKSRIEWMQDSQGMAELEAEIEAPILDYLAANYGQKTNPRRRALPAHLMPATPNP